MERNIRFCAPEREKNRAGDVVVSHADFEFLREASDDLQLAVKTDTLEVLAWKDEDGIVTLSNGQKVHLNNYMGFRVVRGEGADLPRMNGPSVRELLGENSDFIFQEGSCTLEEHLLRLSDESHLIAGLSDFDREIWDDVCSTYDKGSDVAAYKLEKLAVKDLAVERQNEVVKEIANLVIGEFLACPTFTTVFGVLTLGIGFEQMEKIVGLSGTGRFGAEVSEAHQKVRALWFARVLEKVQIDLVERFGKIISSYSFFGDCHVGEDYSVSCVLVPGGIRLEVNLNSDRIKAKFRYRFNDRTVSIRLY